MARTSYFGKFKVNGFGIDLRKKITKSDYQQTTKSRKREKNGCFCCRKRKIKCLGQRPNCANCEKAGYLCVWPESEESLSHNSNFHLRKKEDINRQNFVKRNDNLLINDAAATSRETMHDALFRKMLVEINTGAVTNEVFNMSLFPSLSEENVSLFDAFISGFMTTISPQLAHFKLQPGSAFIPSGADNRIVQNLFGACGASFLYSATKNNEMKLLSQTKINQSASQLLNYTLVNGVDGNESWIIIFFLLSYLKLRFVYDGSRMQTLTMLTIIESIKLWVFKKKKMINDKFSKDKIQEIDIVPIIDDDTNIELLECETEEENENIFTVITNNFRILVSENEVMKQRSKFLKFENTLDTLFEQNTKLTFIENSSEVKKDFGLLPYERTMLESFVYNYANMLISCDRSLVKEITSPFIMFDMLRPYLSVPIYKCPVPWMNHPVVGAALPLLELQAKCCWIGLSNSISSEQRLRLISIINTVKCHVMPVLPIDVKAKEPEKVQKKLLESCYVAEILSKAIFVYSSKLLDSDLNSNDESIQDAIEQAYEAFQNISIHSQVHMALTFSLAVIGSAAIKKKHRRYFQNKLQQLKMVFKVYSLVTIEKLYDHAWITDSSGNFRSWDVLYDYECLKWLVL